MQIAILAFFEGRFEVRNAWPPESGRIGELLHKFGGGRATADLIEEFRRLAGAVLRGWQPQLSPAFRTRIESALRGLDDSNREEKMPDPFSQSSVEPQRPRPSMFPPRVPPSKAWLGGVGSFGIEETHAAVTRVMEILQKSEAAGPSRAEIIEFLVLNDGLLATYGPSWCQKQRNVSMADPEKSLADAKENLGEKAYLRLARIHELSQKIGVGTNSKEELEEPCRLYAELDEQPGSDFNSKAKTTPGGYGLASTTPCRSTNTAYIAESKGRMVAQLAS